MLKLLLPFTAVRLRLDPLLVRIAEAWIACNSGWMALTQKTKLGRRGDRRTRAARLVSGQLQPSVVGRHPRPAAPADAAAFPLLKFFLKQQLIWVPVMGLAWWALDFPFMRRHSEAVLKAHPELRGKDQEATRRACEKFSLIPTSVMNFCEGTRFTVAKHRQQQSPYRHLLKPKAGGIALALNVMGDQVPCHSRCHHRLPGWGSRFLAFPLRPDAACAGSRADPVGAQTPGDRRLCQRPRRSRRLPTVDATDSGRTRTRKSSGLLANRVR
jgi:hypothetical protein